MANEIEKNNGEIIIYQSEDGKIRLDVRLENKGLHRNDVIPASCRASR